MKTRNILTWLFGHAMRLSGTKFRFSKDWRWGVYWYHRLVYACICTFECNLIADQAHEVRGKEA